MTLLSLPLGQRFCQVEEDIPDHDLVYKNDVPTWKSCAEECSKNNNCYAWTWVSDENTQVWARRKCFLKDETWTQAARKRKANHISGDKTCGQSEFCYRNKKKLAIFRQKRHFCHSWSLGDSEWGLKASFCYNLVRYMEPQKSIFAEMVDRDDFKKSIFFKTV